MFRYTLQILILLSLLVGACSSRKNKLDRSGLIPEDDLVSILADVYLTDGLLANSEIYSKYISLDSLAAYEFSIEKHGYTKESMDKTMKYYFIKKPKKLVSIYDQVLGILSEMETRTLKQQDYESRVVLNRWTGKNSYYFPDPSATDSTFFDLTLDKPSLYSLEFTTILFPDDQTKNARYTIYTCNPDSIDTGKRNYYEPIRYIKDGHPHTYSLRIRVSFKNVVHVHGNLYDFDNKPDEWGKHILIHSITLSSIVGKK
jgi:hypothetical protein